MRNSAKCVQRVWLAVTSIAALSLSAAAFAEETKSVSPASITAAELAERIELEKAPVILDVRSEEEFTESHIPGAVNIPHDQLEGRLSEIPAAKTEEIVVHCQSGRRAGMAETVLIEAGYSDIRDLDGHMQGWRQGGYPIQKP